MPKRKCRKGSRQAASQREERQIVKDLERLGYRARKQPGSGNRDITLQHDACWLDSPIGTLHIEDKYRTESQWKRLETYKQGADILTLRCSGGERMAFLSWDLLLQLVGSAADRSENLADLPSVEPDKPWIAEPLKEIDARWHDMAVQRDRIIAAHQNPPKREAKPNKLKGRGFGK